MCAQVCVVPVVFVVRGESHYVEISVSRDKCIRKCCSCRLVDYEVMRESRIMQFFVRWAA